MIEPEHAACASHVKSVNGIWPTLDALVAAVRSCRACESVLQHGARPIVRATASARILVVGQAPGRRVHATGIPWDDPIGERLRAWMGIERGTFYALRSRMQALIRH